MLGFGSGRVQPRQRCSNPVVSAPTIRLVELASVVPSSRNPLCRSRRKRASPPRLQATRCARRPVEGGELLHQPLTIEGCTSEPFVVRAIWNALISIAKRWFSVRLLSQRATANGT